MLSEAFHEGVRHARRSSAQTKAGPQLQIINFDWHGMIRDLKEKESVRCLWEHLQGLLPQSDVACGTMEPVAQPGSPDIDDRWDAHTLKLVCSDRQKADTAVQALPHVSVVLKLFL